MAAFRVASGDVGRPRRALSEAPVAHRINPHPSVITGRKKATPVARATPPPLRAPSVHCALRHAFTILCAPGIFHPPLACLLAPVFYFPLLGRSCGGPFVRPLSTSVVAASLLGSLRRYAGPVCSLLLAPASCPRCLSIIPAPFLCSRGAHKFSPLYLFTLETRVFRNTRLLSFYLSFSLRCE